MDLYPNGKGGMHGAEGALLFSSLLFSSLLFLCTLGLSACNGNGGSHDSGGAAYVPGGSGSGSSGTGGSVTGSGSNTGAISAEELRNLANSGRADSITALFPTGEDESSRTFFLNLSPEDFGVPAGGYMILSIDSDGFPPSFASRWENTQFASDADGLLHFIDIPMVRVGSHVTVTVLCYTADGTLISSGYSSGIATENGVPMEISIIGSARIVLGSNSAPNGNTTEHDGVVYDIIEYTGSGLEMAAVNTTAASTMQVKINGTVVSTTTDQSFTTALADGYNAIEVTVSKGSNEPIVVKRNIYVVRQFTTPVIALGSNGSPNGRTATGSDGKSYQVIEYTGTSLGVTVTNGFEGTASFDARVNGSSISGTPVTGSATAVNATLSDGFNAIVATLTESVNGSVQAEKYVYVVKKLVKPVITMSGGTANGETVASGGKNYQVIEYTGTTKPKVTITNSYNGSSASYEAKLGTTVLSTACPSTITNQELSDGFNAVTATLSEPYCDTLKDEKYYYVVKALTEDDVSIAFDNIDGSVALAADGYEVLYYSYLAASPTLPKVSGIGNEYTGDATTPELGPSYLEITFTGDTTVAQTGSLPPEGQELNRGDCIITVNLCKPKCTTVPVERKVRVKIKPVTVSFSSLKLDYDGKDHDKFIHQTAYMQASNADGTDPLQKTVYEKNEQFSSANTVVGVWSHKDDEVPVSVSAVLTAPDSTFRFWTTAGYLTYDHNPEVTGNTPVGSYDGIWTLDQLKTQTWPISQYTGSSGAASRYTFILDLTD